MKLIKEILTSKIGYLVMFSHWVLCAVAIYQRGGLSFHFHFYYEPYLMKSIVILDLVWIILVESITGPANGFYGNSYSLGTAFLLAGIQWFLIGYFIGKIKTNKLK